MRTAVVVAGGRSTRFGDQDKIVADLGGVPMVRRVTERLARACDAVVLNCRADQRDAVAAAVEGLSVPHVFAIDSDPDHGPVAGIRTGLRAVESEFAVVVAGDMPFVDPAFVDYLFERVDDHDVALPRPDDWYQPMQAVYRADAMADACDEALAADEHPRILTPVFDFGLSSVVVEAEEIAQHAVADTFDNINTEAELQAAAERLDAE